MVKLQFYKVVHPISYYILLTLH